MAARAAAKSSTESALRVAESPGKSTERIHADLALDPAINAASTVRAFGQGTMGKLEITEVFESTMDVVARVKAGDMSGPEAMLVSQASALNSMFTELARRAAGNMGEYMNTMESYLRLGLKAQAQCRATIETLAVMKNPPIVIARQANIANGPQQVNNGMSRAEKQANVPNELLETDHGERLDPGAPGTAGGGHSPLVAVEARQRA